MLNSVILNDGYISQRMSSFNSADDGDGFRNGVYHDIENGLINYVFNFYHETLKRSPAALDWLEQRGLSHPDMVDHFCLGYADRTLGLSLPSCNKREAAIVRGALQRTGLLKPSGHEFFRGSLVFPSKNAENEFSAAYGRRTTPKLKSGSVYHVQWLCDDALFFNQEELHKSRSVIVTKSPVDALTFWNHGFRNVIALFGMRRFGAQHLRTLENAGVKEVIVALDGSAEGNKVSRLLAQALNSSGIECKRLGLPKGMDANDFALAQDYPRSAFTRLLEKARPCPQTFSNMSRS